MSNNLRERINAFADRFFPDDHGIILYDGFDEALVGFGASFHNLPCAIYNYEKCIDLIMKNDSACEFQESDESDFITYDDAVEYFEFNVIGGYVGEQTPIFMRMFDKDILPEEEPPVVLS